MSGFNWNLLTCLYIDYPNNFSANYIFPQSNNKIEFEFRKNNTVNEDGVAIVENVWKIDEEFSRIFIDLISRANKAEIKPHLYDGEGSPRNEIQEIEAFEWILKESVYYRDIICIYYQWPIILSTVSEFIQFSYLFQYSIHIVDSRLWNLSLRLINCSK
jgi:hypothetical protein